MKQIKFHNLTFELLSDQENFLGLGAIHIGNTQVRSGRLPLRPRSQSFKGSELIGLQLLGTDESGDEIRIRLAAGFRPMPVKMMRDHSFDPIHDLTDWDNESSAGSGELDLVIRPSRDSFNGVEFYGFSYHYEYRSEEVPLFYLLDLASWEIDGDIEGATAVSQSSCSNPVVTFEKDTHWTTEGLMHWDLEHPNPVMTHNLPRWASHQAFDFQYKGHVTLLGVFERVGLIRSALLRESGKAELKTFDKHIFDQSLTVSTPPRKILLNSDPKTDVAQRNIWTWVIDEVHRRAREEFNLVEEPMIPRLAQNYWHNFTVESYRNDLLPAAASIGVKQLFVDNLKKSAMTDKTPFPGKFNWNMCCGHEYEIAPELGGNEGVRAFVEECAGHGIHVMSWTNNTQALSSPINAAERDDKGWFVLLDDTRLKYGGAYAGVMSVLDLKNEGARRYFIDAHIRIKEETGLAGYLYDSFYNLGFMPISFRNGNVTTMWKECVQAVKELQDAGVHFLIESFGPFGQPQHGCPKSYSIDRCWVVYKVGLGNDYTTITSGPTYEDPRAGEAAALYYILAHMTCPPIPLFKDGKRIDELWTDAHRRALNDYQNSRESMKTRYLQEDDLSVIWHNESGSRATIWNFADRHVSLPGEVTDLTLGQKMEIADKYELKASHTYGVEGENLPS